MSQLIKPNKRIINFMLRQVQPYWTPIKFGSHYYILTFEHYLYIKTN